IVPLSRTPLRSIDPRAGATGCDCADSVRKQNRIGEVETPMDPQSSTPPTAPRPPSAGLPPVTPPSGRFIAQLFLVPGMIVLVAVLMLLAFRYLLGGGYTPENFLKQ